MPWTRVGDSAATYPPLMQTMGVTGADERTLNEVAGWLFRCAFQSAAHTTDYAIDLGTAWMLGGARTEELLRVAETAGLVSRVTVDGVTGLRMVQDAEFIHIRLKSEVTWERQQRNDTRDPRLRAPVLRRDGDNCRWCGFAVQWRGRTSSRTGTLDHVFPGQPGLVTTMVVACKGCNSARQDNPQWDDDHDLLPEPPAPRYGTTTAAYLSEHGYPTEPNAGPDTAPPGVRPAPTSQDPARGRAVRPGSEPVADPAPSPVRPGEPPPGGRPPGGRSETRPEVGPNGAPNSTPCSDGMSSAGSGRVGTASGGEVQGRRTPGGGRRRGRRRGGRGAGKGEQEQEGSS